MGSTIAAVSAKRPVEHVKLSRLSTRPIVYSHEGYMLRNMSLTFQDSRNSHISCLSCNPSFPRKASPCSCRACRSSQDGKGTLPTPPPSTCICSVRITDSGRGSRSRRNPLLSIPRSLSPPSRSLCAYCASFPSSCLPYFLYHKWEQGMYYIT